MQVVDQVQHVTAYILGAQQLRRHAVVRDEVANAAQVLGACHLREATQPQITIHPISNFSHGTPPCVVAGAGESGAGGEVPR
jgi:hypothetical protein